MQKIKVVGGANMIVAYLNLLGFPFQLEKNTNAARDSLDGVDCR